jgi:SAM-dependent methyltransferase
MHPTAMRHGKAFFDAYAPCFDGEAPLRLVEIGSQDVNGSLREVCPPGADYTGVDFVAGKGVDVVLDDAYSLPFEGEAFDMVVSSSCFEHAEMFWLTFLEALRVLKPKGLFYLNATSSGAFHRHPVDCWRFYPDSGKALIAWARRNGVQAALLESFVSDALDNPLGWTDFVAVFVKSEAHAGDFPRRIVDGFGAFKNGVVAGGASILNYSELSEHQKKLQVIQQIITNQIRLT